MIVHQKNKIAIAIVLVGVLCALCSGALFGQESEREITHTYWLSLQAAYYFSNYETYSSNASFAPIEYGELPITVAPIGNDSGRALGYTWGSAEAQVVFDYELDIPLFFGEGLLFSYNALTVGAAAELSPVHMQAKAELFFTPIAFFTVAAGGSIGSGWTLLGFTGLGLHADESGNVLENAFDGAVGKLWLRGRLEFDTSAFVANEWARIVGRIEAQPLWQTYSSADDGQPWQYKADDGQNLNGWEINYAVIVAYVMPIPLNAIGLMFEGEHRVGESAQLSPIADGGWGSDFFAIDLSPFVSFTLADGHDLQIAFEFSNAPKYSDDTIGYNYLFNRSVVGDYFYFNRIKVNYQWKIATE